MLLCCEILGSHHGKCPCVTLYVGLGGLKSPRCHIHCRVTAGKLLHIKTHIGQTSPQKVSQSRSVCPFHVYHILVIGDTQFIEVFVVGFGTRGLPHIKYQLEPEIHAHLQGNTREEVTPFSPFSRRPSGHPTCLVAWPTLCRLNR